MNETPFQQFIALVEVDQKINTLQAHISTLHDANKAHQNKDTANQVLLKNAKDALQEMRKEVDAKELEMKTLDQQESDKKKKLDFVANHKEYQSIKEEIDQVKKAQHALEDTLIQAWNRLETAKKEYDAAMLTYDQQNKELQEKVSENNQKIEAMNLEKETLITDRNQKEQHVPAEWIEKYSIMRARVTNPVVPVNNGNCSACFYQISAQDMQSLKRNKLVQCKDCFRLLYIADLQSASLEQS